MVHDAGSSSGNVGVAIAIVCGAGAATSLGASCVFFPQIVKRASRRVLASALGISAGLILYISLIDIFYKSVTFFILSGESDHRAYIYSTLSFFGGAGVMLVRGNKMFVDVAIQPLDFTLP